MFILTLIVPATTTLVAKAPGIQAMQQQDPKSFAIVTSTDPATSPADRQAAAAAFSPKQLAYLQTNGPVLAKAAADNPRQWETWWWICAAGQQPTAPSGMRSWPRCRRKGLWE